MEEQVITVQAKIKARKTDQSNGNADSGSEK